MLIINESLGSGAKQQGCRDERVERREGMLHGRTLHGLATVRVAQGAGLVACQQGTWRERRQSRAIRQGRAGAQAAAAAQL